MNQDKPNRGELDDLLRSFWQTFPPIWHATRSITHQTATDEFGITAAQFHTLRRIAEGWSSVSDLADCMHLSRPNVSRTVDELVNAALVQRARDPRDRRTITLSLTRKGEELIENLHRTIGEKMKNRLGNLEQDEIDTIQQALAYLQKIFGRQENPHKLP